MAKSQEQRVIDILRTTHEFTRANEEAFPGGRNPLEEELEEALDGLSLDNLMRMGTRRPLQGSAAVKEAAETMDRWSSEEIRLVLGNRARKLYVAHQNLAIAKILGDQVVTLNRLEDAPPRALATEVSAGFESVEGPVRASFVQATAQHGRLDVGGYVGHFFAGPGSEPVLDLRIGS